MGYTIGGMRIKGAHRVDDFSINFLAIDGQALNPRADHRRSNEKWYGGRGGGAEVLLGGDGKPVVGIHAGHSEQLESLGLIQLKN